MIWKPEYKIGMQNIDRQHRELFIMTEHLLKHIIKSDDYASRKKECVDLVLFLKGYSIQHFDTEEKYMVANNYCDYEAHKEIHKSFIDTVLVSERRMQEADFSLSSIKEFAGFLTAWLIYHVADADQKLKSNEPLSGTGTSVSFYISCFAQSARAVLKKMVGLTISNVIYDADPIGKEDVLVQIGLIGSFLGKVVFVFPKDTTFALLKAITRMELNVIDEIAYSALCEMVNIISGNAATLITKSGEKCDIKTPHVISNANSVVIANGFQFDTEYGKISVHIELF